MKFKAGDRVRIKKDLIVEHQYGHYEFVTQMEPYLGTVQTIKEITYTGDSYKLKNIIYTWTDEMLEPFEENYNITVSGNTVIVKTEDGNYTGVAICSPEDTFDLATGVKLAIERLQKHIKSSKIPTYNTETNLWEVIVDGKKEEGSLEYIASEFIKDSLYYPFKCMEDKTEYHVYYFNEVIEYAIYYPYTFYVKDYKEYYSKQQLQFLDKLTQKLREVV